MYKISFFLYHCKRTILTLTESHTILAKVTNNISTTFELNRIQHSDAIVFTYKFIHIYTSTHPRVLHRKNSKNELRILQNVKISEIKLINSKKWKKKKEKKKCLRCIRIVLGPDSNVFIQMMSTQYR